MLSGTSCQTTNMSAGDIVAMEEERNALSIQVCKLKEELCGLRAEVVNLKKCVITEEALKNNDLLVKFYTGKCLYPLLISYFKFTINRPT